MAEIFLAVERGPRGYERVIVLKRLLPEHSRSADIVQMFLDEGRLSAQLSHPNVIRTIEIGEVGGRHYLTMEYLAGEDLGAILRQTWLRRSSLSFEMVAKVQIAVADGLHYAHERHDADGRPLNIVHRDVSPSNVIVTYKGDTKLVDFGIARAETNLSKTAGGKIKGKVPFLSPEQLLGAPTDRRVDLFSFGALTHELLTGKRLFQRKSQLESAQAILRDEIPTPSAIRRDVPAALDRIVMKCLTRNPADRYQTALQISADLRAFLSTCTGPGVDLPRFLEELFGQERRLRKLGIAQGSRSGTLKAESPHSPALRGGDATQKPSRECAQARVRPTTPNSWIPVIPRQTPVPLPRPEQAAPRVDPSIASKSHHGPAKRERRPRSKARVWIALGVLGFAGLVNIGYFATGLIVNRAGQGHELPVSKSPLRQASVRFEGLPAEAKVRVDDNRAADRFGKIAPTDQQKLDPTINGFAPDLREFKVKAGEARSLESSVPRATR